MTFCTLTPVYIYILHSYLHSILWRDGQYSFCTRSGDEIQRRRAIFVSILQGPSFLRCNGVSRASNHTQQLRADVLRWRLSHRTSCQCPVVFCWECTGREQSRSIRLWRLSLCRCGASVQWTVFSSPAERGFVLSAAVSLSPRTLTNMWGLGCCQPPCLCHRARWPTCEVLVSVSCIHVNASVRRLVQRYAIHETSSRSRLGHGLCLMGSHRVTCHQHVLYPQG